MRMRKMGLVIMLIGIGAISAAAHPGHEQEDEHLAPLTAAAQNSRRLSIETRGAYRYIESDGMPDHPTGAFPNRGNPNRITAQNYRFRVPVNPKQNDNSTPARGRIFGVAVNGIVFDPGTAEFWRDDPSTGWNMEAIGGPRDLGLDQNNAHVQPSGAYHYHGVPIGLIQSLAGRRLDRPLLIGWAADGFPIYAPLGYSEANDPKSKLKPLRSSYQLKDGERPARPEAPGGKHDGSYTQDWHYVAGSGDLDENNGRFGVTPEFPDGTYYYVVTEQFPFIPRSFAGTPDESFALRRPGGRGGAGAGPPGARVPRGQRPPPPPR